MEKEKDKEIQGLMDEIESRGLWLLYGIYLM